MKESITKFDLEAAFKALDELDLPTVENGIKANRPALTEIFSHKTKFDALMEEYYDVGSMTELGDAQTAREAEVAKAKLARIEKIVDLDAESPEELLPSYVGKFIMQCPQCMTLFYKDPDDVEASEEDPAVVNVNEVCQHCGNDSGYTLIGKVGEATQEETAELNAEETVDVTSTEEDEELAVTDEATDDSDETFDLDADLEELDLEIEDEEEVGAESAEESFSTGSGAQALVEQLTEEADLDVSAEEFEKLISSPEFKKPISDGEARAMMDELGDSKEEVKESASADADQYRDDAIYDRIYDVFSSGKFIYKPTGETPPKTKKLRNGTYQVTHKNGQAHVIVEFDMANSSSNTLKFTVNGKSCTASSTSDAQDFILKELANANFRRFDVNMDESVHIDNETLKFAVINPDGTYAGVPCASEEEARELAAQKDGRVVVKLELLEEGIFDKLKDTVDNIAGKLKSRDAKADWVLNNAMEDYNSIQVDNKGKLVPDEKNQRFHTFIVVGFTDKYKNGKTITTAPSFNNQDLIIGKNGIQAKKSYKDADNIAKGWSMTQGNGPAFIYLAKSKDDNKAVFLCEYFKGELANDQLEKYFKVVKDHLKGAKLMAKGGMNADGGDAEQSDTEANEAEYQGKYLRDNLTTVMNEVDDLQESVLEKLISDSLVEAYGNVAGFRLAECSYLNERFKVDGTIYFTSGNTRKTTYTFSEALSSRDGRVSLRGLNEKLGLDKQFTITGYTNSSKTFITESFKTTKK
jgi:hypothetical protein